MEEGSNMPKRGERARKLAALSRGKGVKPPKAWFNKLKKEMRHEYTGYGEYRIGRIIGGIWSRMSTANKKKIVKKYQR